MGSSSMAQLNGGGTRPASLQHHELLFLGPDPHQQQRTTPVPRKFEPVEATLVEDRVEEQKTAADAGRAQVCDEDLLFLLAVDQRTINTGFNPPGLKSWLISWKRDPGKGQIPRST